MDPIYEAIAKMTKQEVLAELHDLRPYGGYNQREMLEYMPEFLLRETLARFRGDRA